MKHNLTVSQPDYYINISELDQVKHFSIVPMVFVVGGFLFVFGFVVVIIIQDVPFDLNVCVIVVHFTMNGGLSFIYYYFIIYLCNSLVVKCNIP